jgi:hypothetical protein
VAARYGPNVLFLHAKQDQVYPIGFSDDARQLATAVPVCCISHVQRITARYCTPCRIDGIAAELIDVLALQGGCIAGWV